MKSIFSIIMLLITFSMSLGQTLFDISLTNVNSQKNHFLKEYQNGKAIVLVFSSAQCPYMEYYESRLQKIVNEYKDGDIAFLLVNSNSEEPIDMMKSQANRIGAPYFTDKSKELSSFLGAKKSPEAFLINTSGKVVYKGAIDDNPQVASDVRQHYLRNAIEVLLKEGVETVQPTNRPVGCMIK